MWGLPPPPPRKNILYETLMCVQMERSPVITWLFHVRAISLFFVLLFMDYMFVRYSWNTLHSKGPSVSIVFGLEVSTKLYTLLFKVTLGDIFNLRGAYLPFVLKYFRTNIWCYMWVVITRKEPICVKPHVNQLFISVHSFGLMLLFTDLCVHGVGGYTS